MLFIRSSTVAGLQVKTHLRSTQTRESKEMAATTLTVSNGSLLPSQSIFNEIQSIHDTGFFHEIESFPKDDDEADGIYATVRIISAMK